MEGDVGVFDEHTAERAEPDPQHVQRVVTARHHTVGGSGGDYFFPLAGQVQDGLGGQQLPVQLVPQPLRWAARRFAERGLERRPARGLPGRLVVPVRPVQVEADRVRHLVQVRVQVRDGDLRQVPLWVLGVHDPRAGDVIQRRADDHQRKPGGVDGVAGVLMRRARPPFERQDRAQLLAEIIGVDAAFIQLLAQSLAARVVAQVQGDGQFRGLRRSSRAIKASSHTPGRCGLGGLIAAAAQNGALRNERRS